MIYIYIQNMKINRKERRKMIYLNDLKERLEKENIYHSYIDKERKMNKIIKFQEFKEINEELYSIDFDLILENFDREMIYNQKISIILDYEKNYINLSIDDEKIFSMMIEYDNLFNNEMIIFYLKKYIKKFLNEFDIYLNRFEKIESFLKEKEISFIYDENKLKFLNYEIFYQNENIYLIQKLENEEIQIIELNYIIFENENILNEENIIIQILKLFI